MTVNPKSLANLTGGSRKGIPNKVPVSLRDGVLESFKNRGGVKWLDGLPDEIFAPIFKACLPKQIEGPDGEPVAFMIYTGVSRTAADEARREVAAAALDGAPS